MVIEQKDATARACTRESRMRSGRTDMGLRVLQLRLSQMERELADMQGKLERLDDVGQILRSQMKNAMKLWTGNRRGLDGHDRDVELQRIYRG